MKKIIYIIPVLIFCSACNQLDKYPLDSVNSEVYFKNESQLQQYSNQFYTILPSAASMYNEASDEIAISELAEEVRGTRIIPSDASGTNWNWSMLRRINYMREHLDQCTDETLRLEYDALCRFFRAYLYYDRIRHFGDVPWIDRTVGNDETEVFAKRDSRVIVMQHVLEDLNFAIAYMSDDKSNVYRANRFAAMALKSRMCLFEGTFCKYHPELVNLPDGTDLETYWKSMLSESVSAAEQLMAEGGYALYTKGDQPYHDLFTLGHVQGCDEYILARCYSLDLKLNHNVNYFTQTSTAGHPGFTKRFVNKYLCSDGSRFTDKDDYDKLGMGDEMMNRDPRMQQTMFRPGHYVRVGSLDTVAYSLGGSSTGYQLIKYVMGVEHDTYSNSDCDMPIFRLAEVYLNYAEAKAELGEFTQADADKVIKPLRDRVGMPNMDVAAANAMPCPYMASLYTYVDNGANKGVILEIRRERDIELVQEGFRYWDIMRWKAGKLFEQPYLGLAFAGVSKGEKDYSGCMDVDGDGAYDICVFYGVKPRRLVGCDIKELNNGIVLIDPANPDKAGMDGGYILCNGTHTNLNEGRVWNEARDYLYPIPIRERVLSLGAIGQNPGWDDGLSF